MITRDAASQLAELAEYYPVVSVTRPRQAGKTTLCRATFPHLPYVSLEPLDVREFATADPRGFLASLPDGAVIDEVQRAFPTRQPICSTCSVPAPIRASLIDRFIRISGGPTTSRRMYNASPRTLRWW